MFRKLRLWYWYASAFLQKYVIGITIGVVAGTVFFINIPRIVKILPIKPTIRIGRVGAYTLSQLPIDIQEKVSRGITKVNEDGSSSTDVAKSVKISEDGTEYTYTLDTGIKWSNNDPLSSQDIDINIKDVQVEKPATDTIVFKLKEPFSPFPTIISQPLLRKIRDGRIIKRNKIIGLNQYAITQIKTQQNIITELVLSSKDGNIIYHFYPTEDEALTAFKLGIVDQIERLSAPYLDDWNNVQVETNDNNNRYLALFFNAADDTLKDKTTRQLLAYATPKAEDDRRVISPISKDSWAYNPLIKPYDYNLDTANQMLDKQKEANPNLQLSFEITTTPAYSDVAQHIIDSWNSIGIQTTLKITPFPDTNDYQILLIGQEIPSDPDQYLLWHSTQSTNITNYQNPKIDKLLEDGRKELNQNKRKQIYQDFQRFLLEDSPVVFLNQLYTYNITRV